MESPNPKFIFQAALLIFTILISGLILLVLKLKTGRSVRAIMADHRELFVYSFGVALLVLVVLFAIFVIRNN